MFGEYAFTATIVSGGAASGQCSSTHLSMAASGATSSNINFTAEVLRVLVAKASATSAQATYVDFFGPDGTKIWTSPSGASGTAKDSFGLSGDSLILFPGSTLWARTGGDIGSASTTVTVRLYVKF